jgi:hypothetical protein
LALDNCEVGSGCPHGKPLNWYWIFAKKNKIVQREEEGMSG